MRSMESLRASQRTNTLAAAAPPRHPSKAPPRRTRCCAATAASSSSQADLLSLTQWALGAGTRYTPGLRPEQTPRGRGMITTNPIAAGQALVSVPPALTISSGGAGVAPPPPPEGAKAIPAALWASCPWPVQLAVKLLNERRSF